MQRLLCNSLCLLAAFCCSTRLAAQETTQHSPQRVAARAALEKLGGRVRFDQDTQAFQVLLEGPHVTDAAMTHVAVLGDVETVRLIKTSVTHRGLEKLQKLKLKEFEYLGPRAPERLTDAGLAHVTAIPSLRRLSLGETDVTAAGIKHVAGLTHLESLSIIRSGVTDEAVEHLKELTNLVSLTLASSKVTDAGLAYLKGLTKLEKLDLYDTVVTDAGLEHLQGLTNLKVLLLKRTNVTAAGVEKFQEALPNCKILGAPRMQPLRGRAGAAPASPPELDDVLVSVRDLAFIEKARFEVAVEKRMQARFPDATLSRAPDHTVGPGWAMYLIKTDDGQIRLDIFFGGSAKEAAQTLREIDLRINFRGGFQLIPGIGDEAYQYGPTGMFLARYANILVKVGSEDSGQRKPVAKLVAEAVDEILKEKGVR